LLLILVLGILMRVFWLGNIGRGRNCGSVLVGWVILLGPPVGHHADFLFLHFGEVTPIFLGTACRLISFC